MNLEETELYLKWKNSFDSGSSSEEKRLWLSTRNLGMATFQSSTEEEKTFGKRLRVERV